MDNLNLAARLVTLDWSFFFELYGAIFASFACGVVMFGFMLFDELMQNFDSYMAEEWEQIEGQVSLIPLPVIVKEKVFYRNKKEHIPFGDELAFWPQTTLSDIETWDWPGSWINDSFLDLNNPEEKPLIDPLTTYDEFILVECLEA